MTLPDLKFRVVNRTGQVIAKQRYYDDTYLIDDDGKPVMFICDAAIIDYPSGRRLKTKRDVLEFASVEALLAAVVAGAWEEAPLEDRSWSPVLADPEEDTQ